MTKLLSTARRRNVVAALLAGGLLTSLSACGGSSPSTAPVSESQPIQGSPLVACGMAQLSPRVPDRDPMLTRANTFYNRLDQTQLVPPAVHDVYGTDVNGLNPDQQHEVLLLLGSLHECPGLSPQLQQSVLDVFDRLAPDPVDAPGTSGERSSSGDPVVVLRSVHITVEASPDHWWCDGEWDGHPWWFRPVWHHPIIDLADWAQWGADRRVGIVWFWEDSGWRRIGRPGDASPDRPWLPVAIGPGKLNHQPSSATGPTQNPMSGQLSPMVDPQGTPSNRPGIGAPQQIQRPNLQPDTAGSGATTSPSSPAPSPAPTNTNSGSTPDSNTNSGSTPDSNTNSGSTPDPNTNSGSTPGPATTGSDGSSSTPGSG